jgi:diguanylate cyclase
VIASGIAPKTPDSRPHSSHRLSPTTLAYVTAPIVFLVLMVLRHFGMIARLATWNYVAVMVPSAVAGVLVVPWHTAELGSFRSHLRLGVHIVAVGVVIYLTGWGPVLSIVFAFVALQEMQQWGAAFWRPTMYWSLTSIAVGQGLVWQRWMPSFLDRSQAEVIGGLGGLVLALIIRMSGATGEEKERAEALLTYQARHDALTGLPNRAFFYERTDRALREADFDGSQSAVMLFDLDRFKEINDTLGHRYGDRVLCEIGPRMKTVLRESDLLARLGGDEFSVLLPRVADMATAVDVGERVIARLEEPFEVDGMSLAIEASCGIAISPLDGEDAGLLLQRADVAMYVAKDVQANVVVYTDELDVNTTARLALLGDLRNAISKNELLLHYQPKARLDNGQVLGVEALVRWQHPSLGLLYPDQFIPVAEHTGLIGPLTTWVLHEALRQCRQWLDRSGALDPADLSIAVNLSVRNLLDDDFPASVTSALDQWNVPAHLLEFEITETAIMTEPRRARQVLIELAEIGVKIAIDDFGTGYSSLAYLRDLPVDQLKIDQSFVKHLCHDHDDAIIVRSVVDLGRNLGLQTVAEGVEDSETWDRLIELGCDVAQGHFLAQPMEAGLLDVWLRDHR